jgi:hypothetical protein
MPSTATLAMASDTLSLGSHAANIGSASADQIVSNSGGADASVTAVTITGSTEFTTDYTSGTVPSAGLDTISISYAPTDEGMDTAVVTLSISGSFDGDSSFVVVGSGYALATSISEGFETWPPENWALSPSSGSGAWAQDAGDDFGPGSVIEGSYSAFFNDYDYSSGTSGSMTTPALDFSSATAPRLNYYYYDGGGSDNVIISVSTDGSSFTDIDTTATTVTPWTQIVTDLSSYAGNAQFYLRFTGTSVWGTSNPHIDNVLIEETPQTPVLSQTATSINAGALAIGESYSDTVTIGSNSGAVDLAISSVASDDSAFVVSAVDDTVAAGGDVDLAVSWTPDAAGSSSATVVITSNAPSTPDTVTVSGWAYADDYDHHGFEQTGGLAEGWSVSGTWYLSTSYYHSGSQALYASYSNTEASITTARLDASDGNHEVGFWHMSRGFGDGSADSTTFYVSTDGGSSWVAAGGVEKGAASTWVFSSYDLGAIGSDNVVFKWTYTGSGSYLTSDYFYLDDAYLPAAWVSPDPLLELQGTAATFDVVVAGTETDTLQNLELYNNGSAILTIDSISYVGTGYDDSMPAAMTINPGDTGYVDIYFDPADKGIFADTAMFHSNSVGGDSTLTLSGFAIDADYTHAEFEGGFPDSWTSSGTWYSTTLGHTGGAVYATWSNTDASITTRRLDANDDGNHYVAFWWKETTPSVGYTTDSTTVSVSSDGGATWTTLGVLTDGTSNAWEFVTYDLGVLRSDDVYIKWHYQGDAGTYAYSFYIDDAYVPPTYYPPTAAFTLDNDTLNLVLREIGTTGIDTSFDIGSSQGGIGLVIDSVMSSSSDLTVSLASVAAGDTTASGEDVLVDIVYAPSSFGRSSYTVTFYSNDPNSPHTVTFMGDAGRMVANFDDGELPYGWGNVDNDGDGNSWLFDYSSYGPGSGGYYARSKFSTSGADDWLITRKLSVVADDSIIFFHNSSSSTVTAETLKVFVSTTDDALTSFGSTPLATVIPQYSVNGRSGADLSIYNGQDIYVAIAHQGNAGTNNYSYLRVDDVLLPEKFVSTDPVLVVEADTVDFGLGLLSDTEGLDVSIPIRNEGAADLTYTVASDNDAFTVLPASGTIDSLGFDTLVVTFTASDTGMFAGNVVITHDGDSSPDTVYVMGEGVFAALAEGFETGGPDWTVYQLADANDAWELTTSANSGDYAIWHDDNNVADNTNDWIVSPAIDLTSFANAELSFYQKNAYMTTTYYDYHGVYVSTVGGDPSTDTTWVELSEENVSYSTYTETMLDLSAYDGEDNVYIAFVYHGDYATNWYIDDVLVEGDEANNAPSAVTLLTPEDGDSVLVTPDMLAAGQDELRLDWEGSTDADGDPISYIVTIGVDDGSGAAVSLDMDSTLSEDYLGALYMDLMEAADSSTVDISSGVFTVLWDVSATDGMDTTLSENGPFAVTLDVGWFLGVDGHGVIPDQFALHQNYPNPFNPITTIRYDVPEAARVTIEVYNLLGMRVRTLVSDDHQAGYHTVRWNGLNERGVAVASGMYIYRIHADGATGSFTDIRKLVLMK